METSTWTFEDENVAQFLSDRIVAAGERSGLQAGHYSPQTLLQQSYAFVLDEACSLVVCPTEICKAFSEKDVI